ncbi:MAG: hypothetical protein AAGJ08_07085 [Cyanobacteria bacterium P01_H01_bin.35]
MPNNNEMYADKNCITTHIATNPNSSCSHHKNSSTTPSETETFSPLSDKELDGLSGGLIKSPVQEQELMLMKLKKEMNEVKKFDYEMAKMERKLKKK